MGHVTESFALNANPSKGEATVLFTGYAQTDALHQVGPTVHDYYLVHYIISGKGTYQCLGREYELGPGQSFFIFPGELSAYRSDEHEPWHYQWIGFRGIIVDQLLSQLGISAHNPVVDSPDPAPIQSLFGKLHEAVQEGDPAADLQAGGYLRLLLGEYAKHTGLMQPGQAKPASEIQQQVEQAIRWITLQYYQPISIESLAQSLGYHRTHLSKMFKQHTGLSPMNFLLKIRMERAKLLLQERLTIEQVASSVGFADPLYFSKQFKKWYGKSPSEFRASLQYVSPFDCSRIM